MSKFAKAKSANVFGAVAKVEQEKAQVIALQNISTENLINNPKNGEDITMTSDLEESMKQNGFTDPLEVTDYGMENGKYMILSGHRRRAAGIKVGITVFPCVVRHFTSEREVQNYTLMANAQRDSAKDPCLFCTRYKMHEDYLRSINFSGSIREEVAKRLGISVQQADRYNSMNKVILPYWDLVRAEKVGMSSVVPLAAHKPDEQMEIYEIIQDAIKKDVSLTRDTVKKIVDGYRDGKKTWAEIANLPRDSGIPLNAFMNTDNGQTRDSSNGNRNDEVRRDYDPIAAEYDAMDAEMAAREKEREESSQDSKPEGKEEKRELTKEEKALKLGSDISSQLHKLDTNLQGIWKCADETQATEILKNMNSLAQVMVDEMHRLASEWNMNEDLSSMYDDIIEIVGKYV